MHRTHSSRGRATVAAALLVVAAFATGATCGKPPTVVIESPAHGIFTTAANVTVTGKVTGVDPADANLTVNGAPVAIQPDRTWSTVLTLDPNVVFNRVFAQMTRISNGKKYADRIVVIAGDSVADGAFSLDSIALRLNDSGLDSIEPIVSSLVDLDIATLLPPGTPVINNYCAVDGGFLGCLGRVDVVIANPAPSFSSFGLDVDSFNGFAGGDVSINNIQVNANINGSGLAPSCGLRITASQVLIIGDYTLEPDAGDPSLIDVNLIGQPGVSFTNFNDQFTSGICDFPLIGDLIQLIIGDIQPVVTNGLRDFLADPDGAGPGDAPIAEGIETALANISIAGPIGESLGVMLDAPLFAVDEDVDGITLGSDGRVTANVGTGAGQCAAPPDAPDLAASLAVPEVFPTFGPTTPVSGLPYGLAIGISNSAFNQLLKAQIECGLLQTTLTEIDLLGTGNPAPITTGLLALLIPEFGALDPNIPLTVTLRPTLAPVLTGNVGPSGEIAELRVGGLAVEVRDTIQDAVIVGGQIDFRAGLDFGFDDLTGSLVPSIGSVTSADIDVDITKNTIGTNAGSLAFILEILLPAVLPDLGDSLGAFPLPAFLGLQLQSVAVEPSGDFLSLFVDLVPAP